MRYRAPRIVQPGERSIWLWIALLLFFCLGGVLGAMYLQQRQEGPSTEELQTRIQAHQKTIVDLEHERDFLNERIAGLERATQIDQEAMRQVKAQLLEQQGERAELDEELTFLRSMVSSKESREGVQIQRFGIRPGVSKGAFFYSFTVTQTMKNGDMATGWIFIAVDGLSGQEPVWLPLREITEEKTEKVKMRFKHFQDIEGNIQLPEGFKPLKVIVEVKPNNKNLPELKRRFDWVVEEG